MPFYVWSCDSCENTDPAEKTFEHKMVPVAPICGCGAPKIRDWHEEAGRHIPGSAWPMITTNLTGKPESFESQKDLDRRCKELGVRQRDDSSYIDQSYEGYDIRTGEQNYNEGSGRGNPGCWI